MFVKPSMHADVFRTQVKQASATAQDIVTPNVVALVAEQIVSHITVKMKFC